MCTIHVSACRYIAKLKNIDSGQNAILKHTDKIRGRKKKKTKKRVEALPGTCHMGCLTLEDIDIVEWQVGLECVVG